MAYAPTAYRFSPATGTNPFELTYSIPNRSPWDSPIIPAWWPWRVPPFPIMRFSIMWPYSWPMIGMS